MRFTTTVELGGKTATGFAVPDEVVAELGSGRRPAVLVSIGGHRYRSTIARMNGRFLVPLSAENREAAGVAAGAEIEVGIELDDAQRNVELPAELTGALDSDDVARARFDALAYSNRKEWARWIETAKRPETRSKRLAATMAGLRAGKRNPQDR